MKTQVDINIHTIIITIYLIIFSFCYTSLAFAISEDIYEEDNTLNQAKKIIIDNTAFQKHNFHKADDEDWIK